MPGEDKHSNTLLRKKYRKSNQYICCHKPHGNVNKYSGGICCTYPMVYKRRDISVQNNLMARYQDDEV